MFSFELIKQTYNCSYPLAAYIPLWVFVVISVVLLGMFIFVCFRLCHFGIYAQLFVVGSVLVGSLGNLGQRLLTGCVLDYLNFFDLFQFNLYDVLICLGVFVALVQVIRLNTSVGQSWE